MSGERRDEQPTDIVLIGAGGFARETAAWLRAEPALPWRLLGFLDDDPALRGSELGGTPVLGPIEEAARLSGVRFVVCTGNPSNFGSRRRIVERLGLPGSSYATLVHPRASIGAGTTLGVGSVLGANVVTTADVSIGSHVLVMPSVVLTHDDIVEDDVTIGSGALVAGGVRIERGAYIGAGACIREGRTIGGGALVGMGSVVVHDVPPGEVWCGNPARCLRGVPQVVMAGVDGAARNGGEQ